MPFDGTFPPARIGVADLLRDARALIAEPDAWIQGAYVSCGGRRCAVGAVRDAAWRYRRFEATAYRALLAVATARGFKNVEIMNDRSDHADVLTAFDEAIAAMEAGHGG